MVAFAKSANTVVLMLNDWSMMDHVNTETFGDTWQNSSIIKIVQLLVASFCASVSAVPPEPEQRAYCSHNASSVQAARPGSWKRLHVEWFVGGDYLHIASESPAQVDEIRLKKLPSARLLDLEPLELVDVVLSLLLLRGVN